MTRRVLCGVLTAMLMASCGDDKGTTPPADVTAPGPILDLAIADSTGTSMRIRWTATGDDAATGTAQEYDMRYSNEPITAGTWDDATVIPGLPSPAAAGEDESVTLDDVTWWTRYYVGIRVADEAGNWSDISNVAAGTPMPNPEDAFLVRTQDGILKLGMDGNTAPFLGGYQAMEITADRIYCSSRDIAEFDLAGNQLGTIDMPGELWATYFIALPNDRFLIMNNHTDSAHIIDHQGNDLAAIGILPEPDNTLQFLNGTVVGDYAVVSEDGQNHVMRINLNTYEVSQFKDMTAHSGWLSGLDCENGEYCVCQSRDVYMFTETSDPVLIGSLPEDEYHIISAATVGGHVFVTVNFAGKVYRFNRSTGERVLFAEGLNRPEDLEYLPATN